MEFDPATAEAASLFRALSDPTRLKILRMLACCPGELETVESPTAGEVCCRITGEDKINSTISHHLKILREAGLITMERQGKSMCCCPSPEGLARARSFLESIDSSSGACCGRQTNE